MKELTVEVTQEFLDKGFRCRPDRCPVALAVHHTALTANLLGEVGAVTVDAIYIRLRTVPLFMPRQYAENREVHLRLSDKLSDLIRQYDYGMQVDPFAVHLLWEGQRGTAELIGDRCELQSHL